MGQQPQAQAPMSFDDICRMVGQQFLDYQHNVWTLNAQHYQELAEYKQQYEGLLKQNQVLTDEAMKYKAQALELSNKLALHAANDPVDEPTENGPTQ